MLTLPNAQDGHSPLGQGYPEPLGKKTLYGLVTARLLFQEAMCVWDFVFCPNAHAVVWSVSYFVFRLLPAFDAK